MSAMYSQKGQGKNIQQEIENGKADMRNIKKIVKVQNICIFSI